MFRVTYTRPQNPQHFIALCFRLCYQEPELKQNQDLLKEVWEEGNWAIFECAYGYFVAHNGSRKVSKEFFKTKKEAKKLVMEIIKKEA